MYVCVCNAVTERDIVAAACEGTTTLRQLRRDLGVTADCGRCARYARDCLRSALAQAADEPVAAAPAFARNPIPLVLEAI